MTVLVLAAGLLGVIPTVGNASAVDPPDLSWRKQGHTFEYSITNGTSTLNLNVTINNKTGSEMAFRYWTVENGSEKQLNVRHQDDNRSDYNLTGFHTYLWVNGTNTDGGVGEIVTIGNSSYELTEVTLEHYVFQNESWTFKYDLAKGWLDAADYQGQVQVDLLGTRDENTDHLFQQCDTDDHLNSQDQECFGLTTNSFAQVKRSTKDSSGCDMTLRGHVIALWPGWHVFSYIWSIDLNGDAGGGIIPQSLDGLADTSGELRERSDTRRVSLGESSYVESDIYIADPELKEADRAHAIAVFQC